MTNLDIGDEVYWTDPDKGTASGVYRIQEIMTDSGMVEDPHTLIELVSASGSFVQAFAHELR